MWWWPLHQQVTYDRYGHLETAIERNQARQQRLNEAEPVREWLAEAGPVLKNADA